MFHIELNCVMMKHQDVGFWNLESVALPSPGMIRFNRIVGAV